MNITTSWSVGFKEDSVSYINRNVLIYISGQYVCFRKNDEVEYMRLPSYFTTKLVVHSIENVFALIETNKTNPKIYIYNYPTLEVLGIITDFTRLEILDMAFSASCYLVVVSGIPDYELSVWNYRNQKKLCCHALDTDYISAISVCPVLWRKIVVAFGSRLQLFKVENCGDIYSVKESFMLLPERTIKQNSECSAIAEDFRTVKSRARSSRSAISSFRMPESVIAGVSNDHYKDFIKSQDKVNRCRCVSLVWDDLESVYIGCQEGQIIKLSTKGQKTFKVIANSVVDTELFTNELIRSQSDFVLPPQTNNDHLAGNVEIMCFSREGLYVAGQDGTVRLIKKDLMPLAIEPVHSVAPGQVQSLQFSTDYQQLAVASNCGRLDILYLQGQGPDNVFNFGSSADGFVGISALPEDEYVATVRQSGLVQFWKTSQGNLVSARQLPTEASSLCASPLWNVLAVGGTDGRLFVLDCRTVVADTPDAGPRIIFADRIHTQPVLCVKFDNRSQIIVTAANDGNIMILSGLVSDQFRVIGSTNFTGFMVDLCIFNNPKADEVAQVVLCYKNLEEITGANKILYFELNASLISDPTSHYSGIEGCLNATDIQRMELNADFIVYGCCMGSQSPEERKPVIYTVELSSRNLVVLQVPAEVPKKAGNKASYLQPIRTISAVCHEDPEVYINNCPNDRVIMTYGKEGVIRIVDTKDEKNMLSVHAHQFSHNGVTCAVFNGSSNCVYSCGLDGSLSKHIFMLNKDSAKEDGKGQEKVLEKFASKVRQQNSQLQSLATLKVEVLPLFGSDSGSGRETATLTEIAYQNVGHEDTLNTWSMRHRMEHQSEEDQQYRENKNEIRDRLRALRDNIQAMVDTNETLDDLEKIDRQEFELDVEVKNKVLEEINKEVQKEREKIDMKNLANHFIHDVIKRECWDKLSVKGRCLCSFGTNENKVPLICVSNFALHDRSESFMERLDQVIKRRLIEIADQFERKKQEELSRASQQIRNPVGTQTNQEAEVSEVEEIEDEETPEASNLNHHEMKDYENYIKVASSAKYLYSQLELETRDQMINQIVLIKDIIYQMKVTFNKEFTEVYQKKEQEMVRIQEKNSRILKILKDTDQESLAVPDPKFSSLEHPELLLVVEDWEVGVEKYLTDEERRKLEADRLAEEERLRRERLDNWRERGLEDMMGGVLEIRREDELKKDIPVPAFVAAGKPREEWTDEEKKQYEEYERKVQELNEEREKYRKQLEAEHKKLSGIIDDAKSAFDELLAGLFNRQLSVMASVYQEEVKILRLSFSLLYDGLLTGRGQELEQMIKYKQDEISDLREKVVRTNAAVNEVRATYENLQAEERQMDRLFKKEFTDVHGAIYEHITKAYKKRNKQTRCNGLKSVNTANVAKYYARNPYSNRPSSERLRQHLKEGINQGVAELNKQDQGDTTVDSNVLERMFKTRRRRIQKEFEVRLKAEDVNAVESFLQKRQQQAKQLENELTSLEHLVDELNDHRYNVKMNKEIQIVMWQGHVEVRPHPEDKVLDFTDTLLLHRNMIEELNREINHYSRKVERCMSRTMDNKKKLVHLEWELRHMLMEYEDLVTKMKEIQCFKITKEVQRYLATNDYDGLINAEIQKMEQTINQLKLHQERKIDKKKSRHGRISDVTLSKLKCENKMINKELVELNVEVNERRHIASGFPSDAISNQNAEYRYKKILLRQHLIDSAKAQAREVAVLRSEVERLRMRTFPALVKPE